MPTSGNFTVQDKWAIIAKYNYEIDPQTKKLPHGKLLSLSAVKNFLKYSRECGEKVQGKRKRWKSFS
jgi:hypothetical protein